jgi:hypothetical protein
MGTAGGALVTTPEQAAWDSLRPVMQGCGLDPHRVENIVGAGTPDVDYAGGNIELKALTTWPKRPGTPISIPEFTGEQAGWLGRRWEAGGLSWLAVRNNPAWYFFDGWTALRLVYRGATRQQWDDQAALVYPGIWNGGRGWGTHPAREGSHPYSRQLRDLLRFDLDSMQPWSRARAMRLKARKTLDEVALDLGIDTAALINIETGGTETKYVMDLLDYWNN